MSFLAKNIKYLRENRGLTQTQFGDTFKCSRNNVVSYEQNTVPKLELLLEIVNFFNTTVEEIYTTDLSLFPNRTFHRSGKQNVVIESSTDSSNQTKSKNPVLQIEPKSVVQYVVREDYNLTDVPLLDMAAAANSSSGYLAPDNPETVDHLMIPESMLKRGRANYAFRVVNDSMEPTLYIDDIIVVTHVERSMYDQIREDRVCVVVTKSKGVIVKRIRMRLSQNSLVRCRSDNKFYPSFNVYADDLLNIFEVKCKISFNLPNEMSNVYDMYRKLEDRIEDLEIQVKKPRN